MSAETQARAMPPTRTKKTGKVPLVAKGLCSWCGKPDEKGRWKKFHPDMKAKVWLCRGCVVRLDEAQKTRGFMVRALVKMVSEAE